MCESSKCERGELERPVGRKRAMEMKNRENQKNKKLRLVTSAIELQK